jgi:hypothetical protein
MTHEGELHHEDLSRGQLYALSHPDSDLFSGYGLTTLAGRKDRLVGLLMVDRPQPANPACLAEIEVRYGDYQLVPMTATGERGLVTQMRIVPESVPHLARFSNPLGQELTRVLTPLLETPPAPALTLRWDEEHKLWQSEFWLGLSPELQAVFQWQGYGCLAVERADRTVAFVTHVSDADLPRFHQFPVLWRWEFIPMPTAPLIRFSAAILDNPANPYRLEHFLNVDDPEQARCLSRLVQQAELSFDFYGEEYEYAYSKKIAHQEKMRRRLTQIVRQAIEIYGTIPATQRDFDAAKAAFQRAFRL